MIEVFNIIENIQDLIIEVFNIIENISFIYNNVNLFIKVRKVIVSNLRKVIV